MDQNRFVAPDGVVYVAKDATNACVGCDLFHVGCKRTFDGPSCMEAWRPDRRDIIWVHEDASESDQVAPDADPVASDLAPRKALLAHIADMTAERDELRAQVHIVTSERDELASGMQALRARLAEIERADEPAMYVLRSTKDRLVPWVVKHRRSLSASASALVGSGADHLDPLYARPAPAAEPERANAKNVTLNAAQLRHALDFIAPDFDADPDQRVAEVTIAWRDAGVVTDDGGNPEPAGYVAWITDYPEEGALPLSESWDVMPAATPERAEPADLLRAVLSTEVARGTLHKLRDGQGIDTTGGRAWLAAFAWAGESPQAELTSCQADRDGDCSHPACPLGAEGGAA